MVMRSRQRRARCQNGDVKSASLVALVVAAGCMTRPEYTYYNLPRVVSPATSAERCFEKRRLQLVVARSDVEFVNTDVTDFGAYYEVRRTFGSDGRLGIAFHRDGALRPAYKIVRELGDPALVAAQAARLEPLEKRWHTKIGLSALGYALSFGGLGMMLSAIAFVGDDTWDRPLGLIIGGGAALLAGGLTIYIGGRGVNTVGGKVDVARRLFTDGKSLGRLAAATDAYNSRAASECGLPPPTMPSPQSPPTASHDHAIE